MRGMRRTGVMTMVLLAFAMGVQAEAAGPRPGPLAWTPSAPTDPASAMRRQAW